VEPEILAPAGQMESLYAAVNAGCNAIYMGGTKFGARAYADNPGCDAMADAIKYCHLHNVKFYMTVNTLLKESEINGLYKYMVPYYEAGLDAAIVQDTGVMRLLHQWFPDLALHASTQMSLVMGQGAKMLKKYGVTRIVPARELSSGEIKRLREDTDMEIEVFVHGALCYCYSGQCLFASLLGDRSGNRGRCTQPCRLPYYMDGQKSYVMCLKELCLLPCIGELIEAGANSFKIEGRMKRPAYTASVTAMYRKYTDIYKKTGAEGYKEYIKDNIKELLYDMGQLAEIYNRGGFTDGYIKGRREGMMAGMRPGHGGVYIGDVTDTGKGKLKYKLKKDINKHDVIEFCNSRMESLYEYTTGSPGKAGDIIEAKFKRGCVIHKGDKVYRTRNALLLEYIKREYLDKNKKVVIDGQFEAFSGKEAHLHVTWAADRNGGNGTDVNMQADINMGTEAHTEAKAVVEADVYGSICKEAQKSATSREDIKKWLSQTGNTEFEFGKLGIVIDNNIFLPANTVKSLRRQALDKLKDKVTGSFMRKADATPADILPEDMSPKDNLTADRLFMEKSNGVQDNGCLIKETVFCKEPGKEDMYCYKASVMTMEQLGAVLASKKIKDIYIRTELLGTGSIIKAMEAIKTAGKGCYIVMPHIFRRNIWDDEQKYVKEGRSIYMHDWDGYIIKNLEEYVFLTGILGVKPCNIITDTGLYIMNSSARMFWKEAGVTRNTFPLELALDEVWDINKPGMEAVIYAHVPLMVSAQCISFNKEGRKKTGGVCKKGGCQAVIKDLKDREFIAVNYCKYCYNIIYQGRPLSVVDYLGDLSARGIKNFRYDFTIEDKAVVDMVLSGRYTGRTHTGHYFNPVR